ncbi:hypothetical protein [Nostoc sp. MS1]|uniref:hypothetical protein n=1 Tax=Nostoc sp. MS1 TaxID=2764711 RepID=UPI001CC36033|nr:hypothetical protein [Nostoc sp. MS1]BCL39527.1 hypothetical protein NSMS1_59740 [Nostoc sp. MS1]
MVENKLPEYTDEELKRITILPVGSRLEQGAKYLDLNDPEHHELTAMGGMEAGTDNLYVPKTEVESIQYGYRRTSALIDKQLI